MARGALGEAGDGGDERGAAVEVARRGLLCDDVAQRGEQDARVGEHAGDEQLREQAQRAAAVSSSSEGR